MSTNPENPLDSAVKASWRLFLDTYEPFRPDLFRYCRHLTRSSWDAEDLVQETMFRAFASLGIMAESPRNPRAWLFRVASNFWLNRITPTRHHPDVPGIAGIFDFDIRSRNEF